MKTCIRCKEDKPLSKFENHPTARDGKRNQCSACRYSIRLESDPDYKNKQRAWNLMRYGITIKEYEKILKSQSGVCAICKGKTKHLKNKRLFVDHDHKTGVVRGILCHQCNAGLGAFGDDKSLILAALEYLS